MTSLPLPTGRARRAGLARVRGCGAGGRRDVVRRLGPRTGGRLQGRSRHPVITQAIPGGGDSYAGIVRVVAPAVVTIRVESKAKVSPTGMGQGDDLFRRFFGDPDGRGQRDARRAGDAEGAAAARSRFGRGHQPRRLHPDEQPRDRRRRQHHRRVRRRPHADGHAGGHRQAQRRCAAQGAGETRFRPSRSATRTPCRWATSCWRSATRSVSARP